MKSQRPTLRMCVVCKQMKDKALLIRVAKTKDGEVFVDVSGKAQGRGAFVCKDGDCVAKCFRQKAFNRSFKCNIPQIVYDELKKD